MVDAYSALAAAVDPGAVRPCLAEHVELARFRSRVQGRHAVLHNQRSRSYFRISDAEAELALALDGTRTVSELAVDALATTRGLDPEAVVGFVRFLHRGGFLTDPWIDVFAAMTERITPPSTRVLDRAWRRMRSLTVTLRGAPRVLDGVYTAGGRYLFTPVAQLVLITLLGAGLGLFIARFRTGRVDLLGEPSATTAATLFLLGLVAVVIHELGHALAVRHAGRQIISAGAQLYLSNLVFFIDSSDMVMASRRQRAVNAVAGPYAQALVASLAAVLAAMTEGTGFSDVLFRFAGVTFLFGSLNLIPFLELDGYWLMTDLLDTPDLRPRALAFVRHDLVHRLRTDRRLTRGEWGLTLFGVVGAVFTVLAFFTGWVFWWPLARGFTAGLWGNGVLGRALLILLGLLVLGPLVHGVGDGARAVSRRVGEAIDAIRFRSERRWRVEAAETVARLPLLDEIAPEGLGELAGRVRRRHFVPGEAIVRQGTAADGFYVLRHGRAAIVEETTDGAESVIAHIEAGASFGELAILEGTPRTATVRAETRGEVFIVDAGTFQRLLAPKLARPGLAPSRWPVTQVWQLPPFRSLDLVAAARLAATGLWRRVAPDEVVVRQGEIGDTFYVVGSGQLEAVRDEVMVGTLTAGDFFGEVALLQEVPRTATVRAVTPARLFCLPRPGFDELVRACFAGGALTSRPVAETHSVHG
ncbi:MAG: putative peptide zinc metalloprotease protein [Frankiales bacterium]|nr:putative peptide zinc metalloprotease protein [Frankiales bacterium]